MAHLAVALKLRVSESIRAGGSYAIRLGREKRTRAGCRRLSVVIHVSRWLSNLLVHTHDEHPLGGVLGFLEVNANVSEGRGAEHCEEERGV